MSKKSKKDEFGDDVLGELTPAEYWEWRTTATEYRLQDQRANNKHLLQAVMEKDIEIAKLKAQAHLSSVEKERAKVTECKQKLHEFYKKIKESKGFDMENSVIDEYTYQVKKLQEDKQN